MATNHHGAVTQRVCAHSDVYTFHYKGKQERLSDIRHAGATLCQVCAQKVQDWFAYQGKGFHRLDLPKLVGRTPVLVSWGNRVRIERLRALGPLMGHLVGDPDPLAAVVLRVLELMFKVPSASYWVDVEKKSYGAYSLQGDVEVLLHGSLCRDNPQGSASVLGYWLLSQPRTATAVIDYVKENLKPAIAAQSPSEPVPESSTAYV